MEGVLQEGGPQSCGRWELVWMEPVYVQTCRAVLCHQLRTQRGLLLSCAL